MMRVMTSEMKEVVDTVLAVEKRLEKSFAMQGKDALVQFEKRITSIMNSRFDRVEDRLTNVENRLGSVERRTSSLEESVLDLQEELKIGRKVIDEHSLQLFEHHKRIGRLEKRFA